MKTFITALAVAGLAATSAAAQPPKVSLIRADAAGISQTYAPGNQTFPDTDRFFDGQNARHID
jgi:hypothetical protein